MENKLVIYCDMDGVLADFNGVFNAVNRYENEKDFFFNLEPISDNLNAIKQLIKNGYNVKILSTSPHKSADKDKMKWLAKYLPEMKKENIIFARPKQPKISLVAELERQFSLLLDDYQKNIDEWRNENGMAFKITKENTIPKYFVLE